ncbi:MAG: hypothetical protein JW862_01280 [Anaerolineales bacterium]|nr:hypothetical protein [Anaerolineales bacterium]
MMWNRLLRIMMGMVLLGTSTLACIGGNFSHFCTDDVDPIFKDFYDSSGGLETLGCPLSPLVSDSSKYYQYTPFVLMVYNPNAPSSSQFYFANLGVLLGLAQQPVDPDTPRTFEVYSLFKDKYQELGGARFVGRPITGVETDRDSGRIYQCFENMCFEQKIHDSESKVGLLPLGAMRCGNACNYDYSTFSPLRQSQGTFDIVVDRLGYQFFGASLSDSYFSPEDGAEERIYENVILYMDASKPARVGLRPLPLLLGLEPDPLETLSADTSFNFYAVEGDFGYNVPNVFWDYINRHSGFEFIGAPITRYQKVGDNLYRQCFENVCLHHYLNGMPGNQVQPMALGYSYQKMLQQADVLASGLNSYGGLQMTVWESYPVLPVDSTQVISALIIDAQTPLRNVEMVLTVFIPGEQDQTYYLPPTDSDGRTSVELDPIQVLNGTYIEYELCVLNLDGVDKCVSDEYLIWQTP